MSDKSEPKTKYLLECVGLIVTALGGVVAMVVALKPAPTPQAPAPAPVAAPAIAATANQQPASLAAASVGPAKPLPAFAKPTGPVVDISRLNGFAEIREAQQKNTAQIKQVLAAMPTTIAAAKASVVGYDDKKQACLVDTELVVNQARYAEVVNALKPLLEIDSQLVDLTAAAPSSDDLPPNAALRLTPVTTSSDVVLEFGSAAPRNARAILDHVGGAKPERGTEVVPMVVVLADPSAQAGGNLRSTLYRVTPGTGQAFREAFVATAETSFSVSLMDAAGGELANATRPTTTPFTGTLKPERFVSPLALLGDKGNLRRGKLAAKWSMRNAHDEDNASFQIVGVLPAFVSPTVRQDGKKAMRDGNSEFTTAVTYRVAVPLQESAIIEKRIASLEAAIVR